jgi:hypothetical protein
MTLYRMNSCPATLAALQSTKNPFNKVWFRNTIVASYRKARLARILDVERRRVLPDWMWEEKRTLLNLLGRR